MTPIEVYKNLSEGKELKIVDVREPFELEVCKLTEALHIPMQQIPNNIDKLTKYKELVIMCHHGFRSNSIVNYLKSQGFNNIHNMDGGIARWADEVDNTMTRY